jgi:colicin import membrane protein
VPEITATELRRLRALETRLSKAGEAGRERAAEVRKLRRRLAAAQEAQKEARRLSAQVTTLVKENRALAARLEAASAELKELRPAARRTGKAAASARDRASKATAERREAERRAKALESERDRLAGRVKAAEAQLAAKKIEPLVPAAEVASLVGELAESLQSGLGDLSLQDGEVKLKVATGKARGVTGFVVPTPDTPPEARRDLHEIVIRFRRAPQAES